MIKHINTASDTNTQAMTEVALGLSMAFFALLILALLSMSAGNTEDSQQGQSALMVPDGERLELTQQQNKKNEETQKENETETTHPVDVQQEDVRFIFYHNAQYFNRDLSPIEADSLAYDKPVVLAVPPSLSFDELMQAHKALSGHELQLTAMDHYWLDAFERKSKVVE